MLYRLHGDNASAQKRVSAVEYVRRKNPIGFVRHGMQRRIAQAQALIDRFDEELDPVKRQIIRDFISIGSQNFARRRFSLLRGHFLYPDVSRNLAMMIGV
jgi:hypothetical protein